MKRDDQKTLDAQTAATRRKDGTGNCTGAFFIGGLRSVGGLIVKILHSNTLNDD